MIELPPNGSVCTHCNKGIVWWHACGSTCSYCGKSIDNGLSVQFMELHVGEIFISGGEYARLSDEFAWQKIEFQKHPTKCWGYVNAKCLDTGLYADFGPLCRVLPLFVENTPRWDKRDKNA